MGSQPTQRVYALLTDVAGDTGPCTAWLCQTIHLTKGATSNPAKSRQAEDETKPLPTQLLLTRKHSETDHTKQRCSKKISLSRAPKIKHFRRQATFTDVSSAALAPRLNKIREINNLCMSLRSTSVVSLSKKNQVCSLNLQSLVRVTRVLLKLSASQSLSMHTFPKITNFACQKSSGDDRNKSRLEKEHWGHCISSPATTRGKGKEELPFFGDSLLCVPRRAQTSLFSL